MAFVPETHVAVIAFPFASHPHNILNLTRRLASTAPTVVFSFLNTSKSNQALFHNNNWHNIRSYDVSDGIPQGFVPAGNPEEYVKLFLEVSEKELRRVVKVAEADIGLKVSCLMGDAFLWLSGDIADEINVPWVAFWSPGSWSLSAHFYTDLIRQKCIDLKGCWKSVPYSLRTHNPKHQSKQQIGSSAGPDDEIVDLIPGLPTVRLGDLPTEIIFGNLESTFSTMLHKMGRTLAKATAVCVNSFQELDPGVTKDLSSKLKKFLNMGPFNLVSKQKPVSKLDENTCIAFLDTHKPRSVAYISFGTVCRPSPAELVALAEALDETKTPFLWSIDDDFKMQLPQGFFERSDANGSGKTVPWAPQTQVLDHFAIGVFVTHGGSNSVLESVGAGVPMICRPFFGDHQMNSWMVEKVWEIGVRIEGGSFTKHGTRSALEQILLSDGSAKRLERIEALKDLAHKAVGPNGSSTKNFNTLVDIITHPARFVDT